MFSGTMSVLALLFSIASFAYVNYERRVKLLLRTGRVIGECFIQTFCYYSLLALNRVRKARQSLASHPLWYPMFPPAGDRETQCLDETVPPAACDHEVVSFIFQEFGII
jgi:hypothetical protein